MGYVYDGTHAKKHWIQFADNTVLVTSLEIDNQYLCNAFVQWSSWAGLLVKVSKCHVFGMKKVKTDITRYEPYITINKVPFPPVKISMNFTYLSKDFSISINCDHMKEQLIEDILCSLQKTDRLPLDLIEKIVIYQLYVFSKLKC